MKTLIIEDERMAQNQLARLLNNNFPDMEIVAMIDSVKGAVDYLSANPSPDVIFMDVELSDGVCFEIFRSVRVDAPVIMTTAYDTYAVKAFEAGSIDYLLKPIDLEPLRRAIGRCRAKTASPDMEKILAALGALPQPRRYKERLTVRVGDHIIPVNIGEIAFFYSEDKANYLTTLSGEKYITDSTIDSLEAELDPKRFFRVSRGCIVAMDAIRSASRNDSGRLVVATSPQAPFEMTVSRARVDDFLAWLA